MARLFMKIPMKSHDSYTVLQSLLSIMFMALIMRTLISCTPVDTSRDTSRHVTGEVEQIYDAGSYDIVFKLKDDDNRYYINRGLEQGLSISILERQLLGKPVDLYHAQTWYVDGGHITHLSTEDRLIFDEWNLTYDIAMKYCRDSAHANEYTFPVADGLRDIRNPQRNCILGSTLPSLYAETMDGKTIDDDYFSSKINIINFWFETCPPCVAEMPAFNFIKEKYGTDKINYLAIGTDREDHIQEFLTRHPFNFDMVSDGRAIVLDTFESPWGFPTTLITNSEGVIVAALSGGPSDSTAVPIMIAKLEPILDQLLALN